MDTPDLSQGAMLRPVAEWFGALGWQLVPTQHHRVGDRVGQTPISSVTGGVPFRTPSEACPNHLRVHLEGGVETAPPSSFAKVAIRPPTTVVGFDVDDGYAGKSGGDTLVNAEMLYGPLPGSFSLTARGPYTPSRRRWYRIPDGLLVKDNFFRGHGGYIETIRTGHRYSWAAPSIHTRKGKVVGPVEWYDADSRVCPMPHVDDLAELPRTWVEAIRDHEAEAQLNRRGEVGEAREEVTEQHAAAIIRKLTDRLYGMEMAGGDFRSTLFGIAWAVARRVGGRGGTHGQAEADALVILQNHPCRPVPDMHDQAWIKQGVDAGMLDPWRLVEHKPIVPLGKSNGTEAKPEPLPRERVITKAVGCVEPATDEELETFLASYTRFSRPARLGRRTEWMRQAPPEDLFRQVRLLFADVLAGYIPAARAVAAVRDVYVAFGGTDTAVVHELVAHALGAHLTPKVAAR